VTTISLHKVSVSIPVYNFDGSSLRKLILGKTVGGRFAQTGSHLIVDALKQVSFEAQDGDRIGLVGSNGSGKTTLLRVLAGVYPPTSGALDVHGEVSAMFDVGLGMSMDATGMENIHLCGLLWGLTPAEIEASVPDIIAFTELGDYLNMPVRTYSTGMVLRLSFAIATVRKPDILLLDEVIGVGDAGFFAKAFERLMAMVRESRILFLASHSNGMIRQLCNKAIWLHQGTLVAHGEVGEVLDQYEKGVAPPQPVAAE
jgi:ABC-2 type transport system ATP-binding protein/lipopolysaccharide transport system ATP-binding protein